MSTTPDNTPLDQSFRATPPPVAGLPSVSMPAMECVTLPSGIRLHTLAHRSAPVIYLTVLTEGGIAEASSPAIAAITAIMQREGSRAFNGPQLSETLDFNGAWIKSDTSSHHRRHSLYSLSSRLEEVLPAFVDMVFHPTFPETPFSVRRESLAKNIEISDDNVSYLARCASDRLMMGKSHPLAAIDTPDGIRAITRRQLEDFHSAFCHSESTSVFVCGDISETAIDLIISAIEKAAPKTVAPPLDIMPFDPAAPGSLDSILRSPATQSAVEMTLPAIPRTHPHYLPLHLTVYALGGYFGSRLMLNIREDKGLTYGISASMPGYADGAYIDIAAETDNAYVDRLIHETRLELRRLVDDPPQGDELLRLKQSAISAQAAITDSTLSIADYHITSVTQALTPGYFKAKQQAIVSLTPADISHIASTYLTPEALRIAIAGNPSAHDA